MITTTKSMIGFTLGTFEGFYAFLSYESFSSLVSHAFSLEMLPYMLKFFPRAIL